MSMLVAMALVIAPTPGPVTAPAAVDPCPAVAQVARAAREPRPFASLLAPDTPISRGGAGGGAYGRVTKPLPGLGPCRIVYSNATALVCSGPLVAAAEAETASAQPSDETRAREMAVLRDYATPLAACVTASDARFSRGDDLDPDMQAISVSAGRDAPYYQFSIVTDLDRPEFPARRAEMLVIGPAPRAAAPAATPAPHKRKARPKRRG